MCAPFPRAVVGCLRGVVFRVFTHDGRHAGFNTRTTSTRNSPARPDGRTAAANSTGVTRADFVFS